MANDLLIMGADVQPLRVKLTTGSDFNHEYELQDPSGTPTDWPAGTTVSLILGGTTWNATISGASAIWAVDKDVADTIQHGVAVTLKYVNGTTDEVWAVGTVVRTRG